MVSQIFSYFTRFTFQGNMRFFLLLDNSPTKQFAVSQVEDWSTLSRTSQLADSDF